MKNFKTIAQLFLQTIRNNGNKILYQYKKDGQWISINTNEITETVARLALGLKKIGVNRGNMIGILSNNSPWWSMVDFGIIFSGASTVAIYPTLSALKIQYRINDSRTTIIFVEGQSHLNQVKNLLDSCPQIEKIILMDNSKSDMDKMVLNLNDLINIGSKGESESISVLNDFEKEISEDDLLTLIYTSGTAGEPKGVMLTHKNLISNIQATDNRMGFMSSDNLLSILPLAHSIERMAGHFYAFSKGCCIWFADHINNVFENLEEVKPNLMFGVPRIYEKLFTRIYDKVNHLPKEQQLSFLNCISYGREIVLGLQNNHKTSSELVKKYNDLKENAFVNVKSSFGLENVKCFFSGGSSLPLEIGFFFAAFGIPVLEAYGLSETSPRLCCNSLSDYRIGTVGKPLDNINIKIADDGEILVKGPNVMMGYYNKPKETASVFNKENWFCTGDIGLIDNAGYLQLTDRKKNIIVTSNGMNVAPTPLENALVLSPFINQVLVVGDKRNFISAIIVPDIVMLKSHFDKGYNLNSSVIDLSDKSILSLFDKEIKKYMVDFSNYESVKNFTLLNQQVAI